MCVRVATRQTNRVGEQLMNICNVQQRVFVKSGGGRGVGGAQRERERERK